MGLADYEPPSYRYLEGTVALSSQPTPTLAWYSQRQHVPSRRRIKGVQSFLADGWTWRFGDALVDFSTGVQGTLSLHSVACPTRCLEVIWA